jgi:hypothetical protein
MKAPRAVVIHRTRGRFRVNIDSGKGNPDLLDSIVGGLSRCAQVESVSANPLTGSVLVHHTGERIDILRYAERHSIMTTNLPRQRTALVRSTLAAYRAADSRVRQFTGGEWGVPDAAVVGLLGTTALQIVRGRVAIPPWHSAFWYAINLFMQTHAHRRRSP